MHLLNSNESQTTVLFLKEKYLVVRTVTVFLSCKLLRKLHNNHVYLLSDTFIQTIFFKPNAQDQSCPWLGKFSYSHCIPDVQLRLPVLKQIFGELPDLQVSMCFDFALVCWVKV